MQACALPRDHMAPRSPAMRMLPPPAAGPVPALPRTLIAPCRCCPSARAHAARQAVGLSFTCALCVAALLEWALNFCLGCFFFSLAVRFGFVPPHVYATYNNSHTEVCVCVCLKGNMCMAVAGSCLRCCMQHARAEGVLHGLCVGNTKPSMQARGCVRGGAACLPFVCFYGARHAAHPSSTRRLLLPPTHLCTQTAYTYDEANKRLAEGAAPSLVKHFDEQVHVRVDYKYKVRGPQRGGGGDQIRPTGRWPRSL